MDGPDGLQANQPGRFAPPGGTLPQDLADPPGQFELPENQEDVDDDLDPEGQGANQNGHGLGDPQQGNLQVPGLRVDDDEPGLREAPPVPPVVRNEGSVRAQDNNDAASQREVEQLQNNIRQMEAYRQMRFQPAWIGGQPPWMDPQFHLAGHPSPWVNANFARNPGQNLQALAASASPGAPRNYAPPMMPGGYQAPAQGYGQAGESPAPFWNQAPPPPLANYRQYRAPGVPANIQPAATPVNWYAYFQRIAWE